LAPGSLLKADFIKNSIEISDNQFEGFRQGDIGHYDPKIVLNDLTEATQRRLAKVKNPALSLSGGLDSRLMAGVFKQMDLSIPAFTYQDAAGTADADFKAVNDIVKQLQWHQNHRFIALQSPAEKQLSQLMEIKQGINYAGMAFILPFLEYFKINQHSMFTGDGGDKVLADLRPSFKIKSYPALLNFLLRKYDRISLSQAAKCAGLENNALKNYLIAQLESYGSSPEMAYTDFLLRERARKWLFEGEDRNRAFCWSTTPFYSQPFTTAALSVSMDQKAYGKMFLELFRLLPGQLENIVNPNWKLPLNQQDSIRKLYYRQRLKYSLPWSHILFKDSTAKIPLNKATAEINELLNKLSDRGLLLYDKDFEKTFHPDLVQEIIGLSLIQ